MCVCQVSTLVVGFVDVKAFYQVFDYYRSVGSLTGSIINSDGTLEIFQSDICSNILSHSNA